MIASEYHGILYWDLSCSAYLSCVKSETKMTIEQLKFAKVLTILKKNLKLSAKISIGVPQYSTAGQ